MGTRGLIVVMAGFLVLAGSAGGATPTPRAATYTYDVRVSGSVVTRGTDSGTPNGDGPIQLTMTYQLTFARVAVRVNPRTKTKSVVVSATKSGTTSGKFAFNSRLPKNTCAGGFEFKNLAATLKLTARGERAPEPRFELHTRVGTRGEDSVLDQIEKAEGKCPVTRPGKAEPPSGPMPAGSGIEAFMGDVPFVLVRRGTWDLKSRPLAQLYAGQPFTLDTGLRRQAMPDSCEPGSCIRNLSGRARVEFRRTR